MDPTLNADLRRAQIPGLTRTRHDVIEAAVVGILVVLMTREAAEAAAHVADVGEVDVAIDDVGDLVAHVLGTRQIRDAAQHL